MARTKKRRVTRTRSGSGSMKSSKSSSSSTKATDSTDTKTDTGQLKSSNSGFQIQGPINSEIKTTRTRKIRPFVSEYLSSLRSTNLVSPPSASILNESNSSPAQSADVSRKPTITVKTNADELPASDCSRGRRNRTNPVLYAEMFSTSDEELEEPELIPSRPKIRKMAETPELESELSYVSKDRKTSSISSISTSPTRNRKGKRKRRFALTTRKNPRKPAGHVKEVKEEVLSDCEVEIQELRICLIRVDDLEEFRESLRKFKENLEKSLHKTELFNGDLNLNKDNVPDSDLTNDNVLDSDSEDEPTPSPKSNSSSQTNSCSNCDAVFSSEAALDQHFDEMHAKAQKPIKCSYCSRFFTNTKMLEAHESQHNNKTKLVTSDRRKCVCQFCQRPFKTADGLRRHIEVRHFLSRPSLDDKTNKLRRRMSVARKHIRPPIRKEPVREPPSSPEDTLESYIEPEPIYVKNGVIDLGTVKEESSDDIFRRDFSEGDDYPHSPHSLTIDEEDPVTIKVRDVNLEDPLAETDDDNYPMADMFMVPDESPPPPPTVPDIQEDEMPEAGIPFDMTNGVQCNISDMGSLLDLLDGPDPNAGVPGHERETLTLNYERNNAEKGNNLKCEFCPKVLSSKVHMLAHRRESHSARIRKPYICLHPNCSQRFESSQSLQMHRNKAHARKEDVAEAPIMSLKEPEPISVLPTVTDYEEPLSVVSLASLTEPMDTEMDDADLVRESHPVAAQDVSKDDQLPIQQQSCATTLAERNEDLLKGLKYICKVCGAKFKKLAAFVQHEWLHSEDFTKRQRRRKMADLSNSASTSTNTVISLVPTKQVPVPVEAPPVDRPPAQVSKSRPLEEVLLQKDAASDEVPVALKIVSTVTVTAEEEETEEVNKSLQVLTRRKPVPALLPVSMAAFHARHLETSVGSPSSSNSSDDASTPANSSATNQGGVSFRIVREMDKSNLDSKICDICAQVCYGTFGLENHMLQAHKLILCIACNLCSTSQGAHELHLLSAHKDHRHFCKACIKLLHNDSHFARHGDSGPHKQKLQVMEALALSEAAEAESNLDCESECYHRHYICDICSSGQHTIAKLELHILQAHQQCLCTICLKLFGSRLGLETHRRGHVGESKFDCLTCMLPFKKKASLASHKKSRGHISRQREINQSGAESAEVPIVVSAPLAVADPSEPVFIIPVQSPTSNESTDGNVNQKQSNPIFADESPSIHELLRNQQTGDYQCCLCLDEFLEYDVFDDHMVIGHDVSLFKKISARVRKIFKTLNKKAQIFKCTACKKIFLDNSAFKRHWVKFHNNLSRSDDDITEDAPTVIHGHAQSQIVLDPEQAASAQPASNKALFIPVVGEVQARPTVPTIILPGSEGEAENVSLPVSIVAPMRTVYACGKCDHLFGNQVELNIHAVNCYKVRQESRKLSTGSHKIGNVKITTFSKRIVKSPQIVDLTEDDDDEVSCQEKPEYHHHVSHFVKNRGLHSNECPVTRGEDELVIRDVYSLSSDVQAQSSKFEMNQAVGPTRCDLEPLDLFSKMAK